MKDEPPSVTWRFILLSDVFVIAKETRVNLIRLGKKSKLVCCESMHSRIHESKNPEPMNPFTHASVAGLPMAFFLVLTHCTTYNGYGDKRPRI